MSRFLKRISFKPLTPASPTTPIANPAASPQKPTDNPAAKSQNPLQYSNVSVKCTVKCNVRSRCIQPSMNCAQVPVKVIL